VNKLHRVRPQTTYIVPVSGGKDSQVCLAWALNHVPLSQLRVVHQNTGYDHPVTYKHLRYMAKRYGVKIEHTHSDKYEDIFDFIEKVGYFPNSVARGCTSSLKQEPFAKWLVNNFDLGPEMVHIFMGMRTEESASRAQKYADIEWDEVKYLPDISSIYGNVFRHVEITLPIVNMTTEQVFDFLARRGDKLNPLYAKGHSRVGCYPCLLARNSEWVNASRDPVGRQHMQQLVQIEDKFKKEKNPRKLIKIHQTRDVRALLRDGASAVTDTDNDACGWCSI
jgi:3'-phosphoadenosine 5'-phosphosulfate sulfotransferase (PAPS reductase)/FAD synthetase